MMRKIAIVSEHASPIAQAGGVDSGGQNIYVAQVARRLAAMGMQVDVFTRLDNPYLPSEMELDENVRIVHVPAGPAKSLPKEALLPYMGDFSNYMDRYFSAGQPYDFIHANFFMSAMASLPVARRAGIPLAVTFHALGRVRRQHQAKADLFPDARFDIEDDIVRRADLIIAECPQDKKDLIELYQADPRRICMVPCGFDDQEMWPMDQAEVRAGLGWDPSAFYLLQLGRMVPRKGIDNVILALAHLRKRGKVNARLCIVGGEAGDPMHAPSPELARLKAIALKEGVQDYVEFSGRKARHQLRKYYCAADVFVTTPWYEPFGITPVEAMACSRPVVGSDTGGIRYTVVDGETGFLVPPQEPILLADKLLLLARDDALGTRMGAAGLRRARSLFTWDRVGLQLAREFEELAGQASIGLTASDLPQGQALHSRISTE